MALALATALGGCAGSEDSAKDAGTDGTSATIDGGTGADGGDAASTEDGTADGSGNDAPATPLPGDGVITLAGSGLAGDSDGVGGAAQFSNPVNMAVADDGTLFVCDFGNDAIRRVMVDGQVSTLVSSSVGIAGPFSILIGNDGYLYVGADYDRESDDETGVLWRVNRTTGQSEALIRDFGVRRGMVPLPDGRLVTTNYSTHIIQLVDLATKKSALLAGKSGDNGFAQGTGAAARFNRPYDIVLSPSNSLIVADSDNNRLREVTLDGQVSTFAGDGTAASSDADDKLQAQFNRPQGLAIDDQGNIYVTDTGSYLVRRIAADGKVSTIAGDGQAGHVDHSDPLQARFYALEGLAVSPDGKYLYIADGTRGEEDDPPYNRVRRLTLPVD